ncbi:MAG: hypothetical protein KA085_09135 [Phenylobacterium sp.]|jgi:hypothetical protein|uniref:hypothetical protein n=1 Tax=Phenylobacterium sp. TaxID=1871053 RepID=UPI001B4F8411|nr:hypothetical protein [Phenylobacterium sp.]MBP7649175.1 hypothetical protein [Phenylobacterium sp.]MBP7816277.1 hypothetical protein [Phenylobacterium sp.]MBP9230864.1 hypothetical protein [Phenylobacterium sp.]MBP9754566.1 hypothetical protein [Phenylobacterium sp.]
MRLLLLLSALAFAAPAAAQEVPITYGVFMRKLMEVQALDAELLSRDSATATLQRWCDAHGPGGETKIVARRILGANKEPGKVERRSLGVFARTPVAYRRVQLLCGDKVLSEADNWYVPARLTPAMNSTLAQTQTPFGVAVRRLNFRRRTLSSDVLLLKNLNLERPGVPHEVLRHRAVLSTPNGRPFSLVVETYTDQLLVTPP